MAWVMGTPMQSLLIVFPKSDDLENQFCKRLQFGMDSIANNFPFTNNFAKSLRVIICARTKLGGR